MRRKMAELSTDTSTGEGVSTETSRQVRLDLEENGVAPELREAISMRIASLLPELSPSDYEVFIAGAVAGLEAQKEAQRELMGNLRDLQELERLMGAFAGELTKLDEVLEVLAAYVCRMRSNSPTRSTRVFH